MPSSATSSERPPQKPLGPAAHAALVVLAFTLFYSLFFAPVILAGKLLAPGDGLTVAVPSFLSEKTVWDENHLAGTPMLADPERMAWYPLRLFWKHLFGSWNGLVVSAYVLASAFTYGYVFSSTRSRLAALFGGLVFGMSGFMMSHLGDANIIHAAAWLPLIVWSGDRLLKQLSVPWAVVASLALANCCLAGHPQILTYAVLLAGAYVLVQSWRRPGWQRSLAAIAACGLVAILLSAVAILPMRELAELSAPEEMTKQQFYSQSLPARQLPQLMFPFAFGGWNVPYFASSSVSEATGFLGWLPFMLAGIGFVLCPDRRLAKFWGAVAVVSLLLALGRDGGLGLLAYYCPPLDRFRFQARHFLEMSLAISVLAGWGVAGLGRLAASQRWVLYKRHAIGWACVAVGLWALFSFAVIYPSSALKQGMSATGVYHVPLLPWENGNLALPCILLLASLGSLYMFVRQPTRATQVLLLLTAGVDLASFSHDLHWGHYPLWSAAPHPFFRRLIDTLAESGQRASALPGAPNADMQIALSRQTSMWKLPMTGGYSPRVISRYARLLELNPADYRKNFQVLGESDRSLDMTAARFLFVPSEMFDPQSPYYLREVAERLKSSNRFKPLAQLGQYVVFENQQVLPRAWIVPEVQQLSEEEIFQAVRQSQLPDGSPFDPRRTALVERPVALSAIPSGAESLAASLTLESRSSGHTQWRAAAAQPSFLVLSDVNYPGWSVTVDGVPAELITTNYVLRGVALPAGEHAVSFTFEPRLFYIGAAVSLTALAGCLTALAISLVWRRCHMRYAARAPS